MIKNEEQFIDFISNSFERIKNIPDSWIGIGDDAASINLNSKNVIFCSDAMVENVHFRKQDGFESVGWKSIVSNQSDLAGMGAIPIAFTITLGVNNKFSNEEIKDLYKGMNKACEVHGGYLVGGDVVHSTDIFVSISAADLLITDESSVLYEAMLLNMPTIIPNDWKMRINNINKPRNIIPSKYAYTNCSNKELYSTSKLIFKNLKSINKKISKKKKFIF